ncbi:MAG TPA: ComF family protein [Arenibaculum sp.]|nr:ComF family protein [Arenibaculum sp.]
MSFAQEIPALLRGTGRLLLDMVLPPRCLGCGTVVDAQGTLCVRCCERPTFLGQPWCRRCGRPFELAAHSNPCADADADILCGPCLAGPPPFGRARSVLAYDDASRRLVLKFKHADQIFAAPAYGAWLARTGADLLREADLLVPVPLHRRRLFARRYNQSALLALAAGRLAGVPVRPDLLVRRRPTRPQGGLTRDGRRRNVAAAFAVRPSRVGQLAGRTVVLVDDVLTTGATVSECVRVLKRAGAREVHVLTLARVLMPGG